MPPRLKALFLLAFALIRTVFRRLLFRRSDGLSAFRENYAADGLAPVTVEQRTMMAEFGRCIACGICDRGERERIARSAGAYPGVMQLILSSSRSMPDFNAAAIGFAYVTDDILAEKERICPTQVPMRKIAHFVKEKASEARVSLPAMPAAPRALTR